ncbi:hypothetical protein [Paenibacillus bovis]|uniref:hypothetical protein n=1 Tax=Paenibacillus bovis TaxID=1616788 RepID=UPI000A614BF6|nr:hypothetical protein [Paenibacillus bovis]
MGKVMVGASLISITLSQQEIIEEWKRKIEQKEYPFINISASKKEDFSTEMVR